MLVLCFRIGKQHSGEFSALSLILQRRIQPRPEYPIYFLITILELFPSLWGKLLLANTGTHLRFTLEYLLSFDEYVEFR